jgi:ribosomal protein S18 acetylase RimI-like enzyme
VQAEIAKVDDARHLVATVVLAFSADPFVRWLLPRSHDFFETFTTITGLHAGRTAEHGGAYGSSDGRAAAFWYPPGIHMDGDALSSVFSGAGVIDKVAAVFGACEVYEPAGDHWYLRQIGIDPAVQGAGHGSRLLATCLDDIDARSEPAYLEATTDAGRRFYERHGFTTLAEVSAMDSPPLWPMYREPR